MKKNKKSSNKSYVFEGQEKDIWIRRLVQKIVDQLYINPEGVRARYKTYKNYKIDGKIKKCKTYVEYNHNKLSRIRRFLNKNLKIIFSNKSLQECHDFYYKNMTSDKMEKIVDALFCLYDGKEEKNIQNKDVIDAALKNDKKKYNLL